jgi:aminopeptidase
MESLVVDAWFEFKDGIVVDFGAEKGKDILEQYLSVDEGAKRLGEVALVDATSPIYKTKLLFGSLLLDENASCHIALGAGYPSNLRNVASLKDDKDLIAAGCNVSLVHRDFMIGSDDLTVEAVLFTGEKKVIIKNGIFTLD